MMRFNDAVDRGRRMFLGTAVAGLSMVLAGTRMTARAYADVKDYLTARIEAVYGHDRVMRYRRSQDNPMIRKLYDDYLGHPMSEESERLLHASYVDRSDGVEGLERGPGGMKAAR